MLWTCHCCCVTKGKYLPLEACSRQIYKMTGKRLAFLPFFLFRENGVSSAKVSTEGSTNVASYVLHRDKVNLVRLTARAGKPDCTVWVRSCQLVTLDKWLNFTAPRLIFVYKLKMMLLSTLWRLDVGYIYTFGLKSDKLQNSINSLFTDFSGTNEARWSGCQGSVCFLPLLSFWALASLELNM